MGFGGTLSCEDWKDAGAKVPLQTGVLNHYVPSRTQGGCRARSPCTVSSGPTTQNPRNVRKHIRCGQSHGNFLTWHPALPDQYLLVTQAGLESSREDPSDSPSSHPTLSTQPQTQASLMFPKTPRPTAPQAQARAGLCLECSSPRYPGCLLPHLLQAFAQMGTSQHSLKSHQDSSLPISYFSSLSHSLLPPPTLNSVYELNILPCLSHSL